MSVGHAYLMWNGCSCRTTSVELSLVPSAPSRRCRMGELTGDNVIDFN